MDHMREVKIDGRLIAVGKSRARWDGWGQALSLLCMAHCLLLPLALSMLPALVAEVLEETPLHLAIAALAAAISIASFVPGFRLHRDKRVVALGTAGLGLLLLAQWVPPESLAETGATVSGGLGLLLAHGLNRRCCRECHPLAQ
jgi:hypothetical protein